MPKIDDLPPDDFDSWLRSILREKENALSYLNAVLTCDDMGTDDEGSSALRTALIRIGDAHGIPLV